jgi:hypothetical protein
MISFSSCLWNDEMENMTWIDFSFPLSVVRSVLAVQVSYLIGCSVQLLPADLQSLTS